MKRKIVTIISVLIIGICNIAYAVSIPDATSNFFVNDFAGIFSDEDIRIMMEKAIDLDQNYNGIQVVVTTVKTIGNEPLEVYANRMYNEYEIGQDDMGVLLLVVTEDRLIRAETGDMMQTYIPDSRIGKLMDEYAIPYLRENKFAKGMISFQDAVISEIKKKVVVEADDTNAVAAIVTEPETEVLNVSNTAVPVTKNDNVVSAVVTESAKETPNGTSSNVLGIVIAVLAGLGCIIAVWVYSRKENKKFKEFADSQVADAKSYAQELLSNFNVVKNQLNDAKTDAAQKAEQLERYQNRADSAEKQIQELTIQLKDMREKYSQVQRELEACTKRLEQAREVCPDIDGQIDAWIVEQKKQADMRIASEYDVYVEENKILNVSMQNVSAFRELLNRYNALTDEQKGYVKTDIAVITSNYEESVRLKREYDAQMAFEAEMREAEALKSQIESELTHNIVPERDYCDKLQRLMRKYNGLSNAVRGIFAITLINQFSRRIEEANLATEAEEQRRYEEEQRRRREEEERRRREEEERRRRQREEEERRRREEEERRRRRQREEEERRRRQRSMSSSSSSRSRSSFGGFSGRGGRSSGGGASGRF